MANTRALNGYSYVLNSLLSYTDPSGCFFSKILKAIGRAIASVARTFVCSQSGNGVPEKVAARAGVEPLTTGTFAQMYNAEEFKGGAGAPAITMLGATLCKDRV